MPFYKYLKRNYVKTHGLRFSEGVLGINIYPEKKSGQAVLGTLTLSSIIPAGNNITKLRINRAKKGIEESWKI